MILSEEEKNRIRRLHNIKEEDFVSRRGYDSDYTTENELSPESKAAEQIFQLFDHKIGGWTISPDHKVTQETQQYLNDWKEEAKSRLEVIINTAVSDYNEQDIDNELNESRKPINEQDGPQRPKSDRSKFLDAYSEMHSHVLNMFYLDKQQIGSHDADKIIINWRKLQRKIDTAMRGACEQYEIAERAISEFKDDWIFNE